MKRGAWMALLVLAMLAPPLPAADEAAAGYVPPDAGAPKRRVGGSSRGVAETLPFVAVVAPDHVGHTLQEQPTLYWFCSRPTKVRIELTLIDESGVVPLLETVATAEQPPGLHALSLREAGIRLQPGIDYQWSVALVPSATERSNDVLSAGAIRRVEAPAALAGRLEGRDAAQRGTALASAGIWYDAIADLSTAIAAQPQDEALRRTRATLLRQVGLREVAAFEER